MSSSTVPEKQVNSKTGIILLIALTILGVVGLVIFRWKEPAVFPSASINLKMSKPDIMQLANTYAKTLGYHKDKSINSITFGYDDEAKTFLEKALTSDPDQLPIRWGLYRVYSALEDDAGAQRQIQWASGSLLGAGLIASEAVGRAALLGKFKNAEQLSASAVRIFKSNNFTSSFSKLSKAISNIAASSRCAV